jgi:hypothetical protein
MFESDEERWLTYAEAAQLLGISAAAARMLAKRRGWPRRTPNMYGDRARVLVPVDATVQPRSASYAERSGHVITGDREGPNGRDQVNVRALDQAITALQEQLEIANARASRAERLFDEERQRADRAERHLDEERKRVDELQTALADAVAAERITAAAAAGLRTELERRCQWGLMRRLRWALRRVPG